MPPNIQSTIAIRKFKSSDIEQVIALQRQFNANFTSSICISDHEWRIEDICESRKVSNLAYVALVQGKSYSPRIQGIVFGVPSADKITIPNLMVNSFFKHNKVVAKYLLDYMKVRLKETYRTILDVYVRDCNLLTQLLLREQSFVAVEVLRDWFQEPEQEDAYKFRFADEI